MIKHLTALLALKADRRAVTALEYGLIASLMGAAIITGVTLLSTKIVTVFTAIAASL